MAGIGHLIFITLFAPVLQRYIYVHKTCKTMCKYVITRVVLFPSQIEKGHLADLAVKWRQDGLSHLRIWRYSGRCYNGRDWTVTTCKSFLIIPHQLSNLLGKRLPNRVIK